MLRVSRAPFRLPAGLSREVVLGHDGRLLIAGGLTRSGRSSQALIWLDPVTGRTARAGRLIAPSHDAAGTLAGGRAYLFGGGGDAIVASVQSLPGHGGARLIGHLPGPRTDLAAAVIGHTAYVLGGFDGVSYDSQVLATTDGRHFRVAATLPVPVRYGAVAAAGGRIWVFGGQVPGGYTSVIQRVSPAAGHAAVAGRLRHPLAGASAVTIRGRIYLAGGQRALGSGRTAGPSGPLVTSRAVLAYRPGTGRLTRAGRLPAPVAYAGAAAADGSVFLVGGENDEGRQVPTVTRLRLVPRATPAPGRS